MSKHTAGPWKAGECCIWSETRNQEGIYIAGTKMGINTEEQTANARLIAAAPELLEACKHIVNRAKECSESGPFSLSISAKNTDANFDKLTKAIVKAEGR